MNVPSDAKSKRVAITSLLAMARSTALIKQVRGAHGAIAIIIIIIIVGVFFVSAIIALCMYACISVLIYLFIFERVFHLTSPCIRDDRPLFLGKDYKRVQK